MYNLEEAFKFVDQTDDEAALDELDGALKDSTLTKTFWDLRKTALEDESELLAKKARIKCHLIARMYNAGVPVRKNIRKFAAPYGFTGIRISPYAKLGKGCTIMPNAVITGTTFSDSKRQGFPTIGDNVFIGAGAVILGSVHVGDNARINANAVVAKDVPANTIVSAASPKMVEKAEWLNNVYVSEASYRKSLRGDEVEDTVAELPQES